MSRSQKTWATLAVLIAIGTASARAETSGATTDRHWVGAWTASLAPSAGLGITVTDRTIRQIVHPSIGEGRLRIRLGNTYGTAPLPIAAVALARVRDGTMVPSTNSQVTFGGAAATTIPVGEEVVSDPVRVGLHVGDDLMVSFYVAGTAGPLNLHRFASATTYLSVPGDHVADEAMDDFWYRSTSFFVLDGVEVSAPRRVHAIVAMGDSITDGVGSTLDANHRYPNFLAARLRAAGRRVAVLDAGIGGNRVLTDTGAAGVKALDRFDHDVLGQPGVRTVIFLEGINDVGFSQAPLDVCSFCVDVSADQIAAGDAQLIARAHDHGLRILGGTLLPFAGAFDYADRPEAKRLALNDWIRHRSGFDGIVDFDAVMGDPADPLRLRPDYDSGDHLHPNDVGYAAMAAAIDLRCLGTHGPHGGARVDCTRRP
jgi:lysophospholipase L1-like esterase